MLCHRTNLLKIVFTIVLGTGIFVCLTLNTALLVAQSNSMPYRYFLLYKTTHIHKGDYVAIINHPAPGIGDKLLTKKLVGVAGDELCVHEQTLWVNEEWQGLLKKARSNGEPLTPLSISVIPEGFGFVAGEHVHSLDSRYQEFGLVSMQNIVGKVYPLW